MRGLAACGLGLLASASAHAADRPAIRSTSDLPPSRFVLSAPPSRAFLGDDFLARTVPALKAEAERVRSRYRIVDTALADQLRAGLAAIALLERRPADAAALVEESRAVATKPQQRAIGMLSVDAAAATASGGADCAAGASRIAGLLAASDPAVVRDYALSWLTQIEVVSPAFFAGTAEAEIDQGVARRGAITPHGGADARRLARGGDRDPAVPRRLCRADPGLGRRSQGSPD